MRECIISLVTYPSLYAATDVAREDLEEAANGRDTRSRELGRSAICVVKGSFGGSRKRGEKKRREERRSERERGELTVERTGQDRERETD